MKRPAVILAVALFLLPSVLMIYRILWLGYPVFPAAPGKVWQLTMDGHVKGGGNEFTALIGLPLTYGSSIVAEERIRSGSLNFFRFREGLNQVGVWSGIPDEGQEFIRYQAIIQVGSQRLSGASSPEIERNPEAARDAEKTLAKRLVSHLRGLPPRARLRAVAATVQGSWRTPAPEAQDLQKWEVLREQQGRLPALLLLLRATDLPARSVQGLRLVESVTTTLFTWVEVWTGREWERMQPDTGEIYEKSTALLPLSTGGLPAVRVLNGEVSEVRWVLSQQVISQWRIHFDRIRRSDHLLDRWSLFQLPPDFQGTFRILLLVPIGALLIVALRNLVGFPTFGIFMPVLMALAFRSTGLVYGLGIFAGVVFIGYLVRRRIERLRLLLVSRLSVILTLVIICITIFALIGNKIGLREFMAVGLLPFVILTMIIERFFVITEEAGIREGLWTAAGTAAVATITHEILHLEPLQLTFFVYPELLFAVAALEVLLGRYTGYRLSEVIRFRGVRGK